MCGRARVCKIKAILSPRCIAVKRRVLVIRLFCFEINFHIFVHVCDADVAVVAFEASSLIFYKKKSLLSVTMLKKFYTGFQLEQTAIGGQ